MNQDGPTRAISNRKDAVILLLILALAAFLRLFRLDYQSLWYDEALTAYLTDPAAVGLSYIWSSGPFPYMPPLHHTLVYLSRLVGTGEASLRLPSVLAGIFTIVLIYLTAKYCFNRRVAAFASLIATVSTFHVYYSQEARAYSLLMLLSIASTYCLVRALREKRRAWWLAYVICAALGMYTHLYMAFVLLAQNIYLLMEYEAKRVTGRAWILSQILPFLLFLPWLITYAVYYGEVFLGAAGVDERAFRESWMPPPHQALPITILGIFFYGRSFDIAPIVRIANFGLELLPDLTWPVEAIHRVVVPYLLFAVVALWRLRDQGESRRYGILFGVMLLAPLLLMFVISFQTRILNDRYFSFAYPYYCILLALGIDTFNNRKVKLLLVAGIIVVNVVGLANYYFNPEYQRDPWREVAHLLEESARPSDVVFVCPDPVTVAIDYYNRGSASRIGLSNPFHDDEAGAWTLLNTAMTGRTRAWLIVWVNLGLAAVYSDALREHCQTAAHHDFRLIRVDLYESCVP